MIKVYDKLTFTKELLRQDQLLKRDQKCCLNVVTVRRVTVLHQFQADLKRETVF